MNINKKIQAASRYVKAYNKPKIFGIGANKTGTSSLKIAMKELDFIVGNQRKAEKLRREWALRDFRKIINYCYSAQFFQDVPFSLPYTFVAIDQAFSGSKFILTVRDDSEQWYNSLTKFHAKKWGLNRRIPTKEDLQNADYYGKGNPWLYNKLTYLTPENDPYNKEILIDFYEEHNKAVIEYFRHRPDDLLIINVADKGAYKKLCDFVGVKSDKSDFPWEKRNSV